MQQLRICAVDPGVTGAIAFLNPWTWDIELHDMPTTITTGNAKAIIDRPALAQLLVPQDYTVRNIAVIEKVSSRPNDGGVAAFSFGMGYGALLMAIDAHGYEYHGPTPPVWKKHFGLAGHKDLTQSQMKAQSLELARQRFPLALESLKRVKDHGRAEAALLALYGVEKILPKLGIQLAA
jgi:crossover junction endodeoxyribonuclease RuvC